MSHQDIITQVQPGGGLGATEMGAPQDEFMEDEYNTEIKMNMRGHMFTITRDDLMALPESILLCLFPNGIFVDIDGNVITNLTEDDVVYVNFAPECFQYICQVFDVAVRDLHRMHQLNTSPNYDINDPNILNDRPVIIVLREDLDYYCIPPGKGLDVDQMRRIKYRVGVELVKKRRIFDGFGYVAGKQLKPAEQHLMDMLCNSGFSHEEEWGHRSLEPDKTVIFSLTLARLNNNSTSSHRNEDEETNSTNGTSGLDSSNTSIASASGTNLASMNSNGEDRGRSKEKKKSRLSTLASSLSRAGSRVRHKPNPNNTKLLLFWRKPARKCWWNHSVVQVDIGDLALRDTHGNSIDTTAIKVHIRRVWTLELSIIGIQ